MIFSGNQYRTKSCEWGGKTCSQTNSSFQFCSYCNGSSRYGGPLKICPLDKNEYYETYFSKEFKEIIIHEKDRLIKSSPTSCMDDDDFDEKIQNCDSKKMWKRWLEWRTESESVNSLTRSKRRFCLYEDRCLFEEKFEEECCLTKCNEIEFFCFHEGLVT